jgi:hypothetical protein
MKMATLEQLKVSSLGDFLEITEQFKDWIFRGQRKESWKLIPKIARGIDINQLTSDKNVIRINEKENRLLIELRLKLPAFGFNVERATSDKSEKYYSQWTTLIIGQHYGFPTRLLDFTENPMVACYFAVIGKSNEDGAVWCLLPPKGSSHPQHEIYGEDPVNPQWGEFGVIYPANIDRKISAQSSVFVYFYDPIIALSEDSNLRKIIITKESRKKIRNQLDHIGINEGTLFPDVYGICKHLSWKVSQYTY